MKIYAVIDTNVIVSALITKREDSPTRLILDYLLKGRIIPVYNEEILKEYLEVLTRSKFKLSKDLVLSRFVFRSPKQPKLFRNNQI